MVSIPKLENPTVRVFKKMLKRHKMAVRTLKFIQNLWNFLLEEDQLQEKLLQKKKSLELIEKFAGIFSKTSEVFLNFSKFENFEKF